jgi:adenine-specific DNA-methyltransferase
MSNDTQNLANSENPVIQVQTTDWNKERLETLKKLFPDLFTNEGKLNIDELKKVVDPKSLSETERYEFRWFGKSQAKRNAFTPSNATLIYDEYRSVNPTESENLIIEGENLEVLKLLSGSYREKIKCIYIDPPYNTGKDFVYSDNFSQDKKAYWEDAGVIEDGLKIDTNTETDGRFHSNWLNMMYSRLLIARQLLREDGVIFISIDDNEVHHLRKLCDEVFGEENFVGELPRITKKAGKSSEHFAKNNDYVICYQKSNESQLNSFEHTDEGFKHQDEWVEERGVYKLNQTLDYGSIQYSASLDYEIEIAGVIYRPGSVTKEEMEARKLRNPKSDFCWRWSKDLFEFGYKNGFIVVKENGSNRIYTKTYQNATIEKNEKGYFIDFKQRTKSISSLDLLDNEFSNDNSKKDLIGILNEAVFEYSKPVSLVKKLALVGMNEKDVFLDFFAGSGTTGQAIIELNKEDGGNRKFILIQIPEATDKSNEAFKAGYKKISEITIERNKRVVQKLIEEKKNQQPDLFTNGHKEDAIKGLGFKVFKLVKSNFPRVEFAPDPEKTDEENIELLKKYISDKEAQLVTAFNRDELMTEILLKKGFNLNYTTEKQEQFKKNEIYLATYGEKETLICLDFTIEMETVEYFKKHTDKKFICLERALDTTKKYNLKHYMGDMFNAF